MLPRITGITEPYTEFVCGMVSLEGWVKGASSRDGFGAGENSKASDGEAGNGGVSLQEWALETVTFVV